MLFRWQLTCIAAWRLPAVACGAAPLQTRLLRAAGESCLRVVATGEAQSSQQAQLEAVGPPINVTLVSHVFDPQLSQG